MYAFGLEETNFYQEAEKQARKVIHGDNWEKPSPIPNGEDARLAVSADWHRISLYTVTEPRKTLWYHILYILFSLVSLRVLFGPFRLSVVKPNAKQ